MVDGGSPPGKAYLSAWPGSILSIIAGSGAFNAYSDDISSEGGPPQVVRLTKLDETAIKQQIESCKRGGVYSFPGFNCATQASICLNAGVPYNTLHQALDFVAGLGNPTAFVTQTSTINTPWNLFLYAKALASKYA
jgi:hypothetical protein